MKDESKSHVIQFTVLRQFGKLWCKWNFTSVIAAEFVLKQYWAWSLTVTGECSWSGSVSQSGGLPDSAWPVVLLLSYAFQNIASSSLSLMLFTKLTEGEFVVSDVSIHPLQCNFNLLCLVICCLWISIFNYFKLELCNNNWNTTLQEVTFIVQQGFI